MLSRFDPVSRQILGIFLKRVAILAALSAINIVPLGLRSPADFLLIFQFSCMIVATMTSALAMLRRDRMLTSSLSLWDESLALNGLALLAHGLGSAWRA